MNLLNYFKETRGELKHVSWPTRAQATNFTLIVIGLAIFVSLLLGLSDFIFIKILEIFL